MDTPLPTIPMNTPLPPLPSPQPTQPAHVNLFKFIQTIQVTPDDNYSGVIVGFARINYVPANDRFVVTFEAKLTRPSGGCSEGGYAYKVYTTDLQETGETGIFYCEAEDSGSVMVGNSYYFAVSDMTNYGLHLLKIDAAKWTKMAEISIPMGSSDKYKNNDPMVAYTNGMLDISTQYNASGSWPDTGMGAATFHQFFTPELQSLNTRILADTPHICGMSMVYVDGVYYLVTANAFSGDVVLMRYDKNWNYLGVKTLVKQAHWSTGLVYDGQRFYLAYLDTSQKTDPGFLPIYPNVHLAAFDRDWNMLDNISVTNYAITDNMQTGRPWVVLHGNRLYVSYDLDPMDPTTHQELLKSQAVVSVYELTQTP